MGTILLSTMAFFVDFDTLGREFRCKWSQDDNNASLEGLQGVSTKHLAALKAIEGVKSVVEISAEGHGPWSEGKYAPEADILADMSAVAGASAVETQTYTFMSY